MTERFLVALTAAELTELYSLAREAVSVDQSPARRRIEKELITKLGGATRLTSEDVGIIIEALRKQAEEISEVQYLGWRARTARFGRIINVLRGLFDFSLIPSGGEWW